MTEQASATIRAQPGDFKVDEIPAYSPSGEGDHLFVSFRKTGLDTAWAVRCIALALGVDASEAGWAGMKDRHAVTTQTASFFIRADAYELADVAKKLEGLEGIEVLATQRHGHKLKTGHLRGNRFCVTLREVAADAFETMERGLDEIRVCGVPNAYGTQRFGRDGDNAERALRWLNGRERAPKSKKLRRLLFSALQSQMFNQVLDQRVADGSWRTPMLGDLVQKHDSGGVFVVGDDDLDDARARAEQRLLSPTGPMFGAKMRWPSGAPEAMERGVLEAKIKDPDLLPRNKTLGRGARRSLRLIVDELEYRSDPTDGSLVVSFVLPKGGYATTVLSTVCALRDATRRETHPTPTPV
jgi:tRNA pseudouridine13 synthase